MATYPHGLFSWADVSLPDPAAGSRFYSELFGWEAKDQHDPDGNYIYTMFRKNGTDIAGMGPQPEQMRNEGVPPMWLSYINVDDLESAIESAESHGGSVVMPAMDVMAAGRMALIADPQGAVAALWEAGEHAGSGAFGDHGCITWNELMTRDVGAAKSFWGGAFGWDFEKYDGPMEYWVIKIDGKVAGEPYAEDDMNGGVMPMGDDFPDHIPSHWMLYFHVDDTDKICSRIEDLGGSISVPAFDTPAGRIAVVADPQGGTFSVIAPPATDATD